ncbi:hypothetical protein DBR32_15340 [Taibaiella sp. KBW10]|uniref:head GIN domain-containing protein n=1 Tax=Taibaiella sp. KBW10 TaxID=2153357 RepID=UPI000F5AD1C5|nr:head GIN domain-containing protein [Taibaiella sp. KBW10]RQO29708.1 hypothetical protein DBR32_15340 [Taibaiella sp. KBW10]
MKKILSACVILLSLVALTGLSSCRKVIGQGATVTEERVLANFTRLQTSISGAVYVSEGPVQQVKIEAQQNIIDIVESTVENGVLKLKLKSNTMLSNSSQLKVYITIPKYREISVMGSGSVKATQSFSSNDIDLKVTGSGDIDIDNLVSTNFYSEITGSGNINVVAGTTQSLVLRITGSGDFYGKDFKSKDAEVTITGSGSATVRATNSLKARISGSGNINYYGIPTTDVNITGSGNVRHQN